MKMRYFLGLAMLLALAGSCKKDEIKDPSEFTASIEIDEDDSKTYLDGYKVRWNAGDQMKVFGNGTGNYTIKDGEGTQWASFTGSGVQATETYRGFYPVGSSPTCSGDVFTFTMPATQTYNANGFANHLNPMAGKSDGNYKTVIRFKNAFAILKLQTKGNVAVTKVEVTVPSGNYVYGQFRFDRESLTTTYVSGGGQTITLDCGSGVTLNETTNTDFYILLPPGCLSGGFDVKYYRAASATTPFSTTSVPSTANNLTLDRNTIKRISLTAEAPVEYVYNLLPRADLAYWNVNDASASSTGSNGGNGANQGLSSIDIATNSSKNEATIVTKNTIELIRNHWYYLRWTTIGTPPSDHLEYLTHDAYWPIVGNGSVVRTNTELQNGAQYGVARYRKVTRGNTVYYTSNTGYPMRTAATNRYQVNSVIFKADLAASGNYQFRFDCNNNKHGFNYSISCPMLIDLTEYYGTSYNGGDVINTLDNKGYFEDRHVKATW